MTNLLGQSLGRYHILEQLGEGGMAIVYKAYDTRLERNVAVKVILPQRQFSEKFLKRFEREAKVLAQLSHPNIVGVIDYGEHEGLPYIVMEYIPAGTLKQKIGKPIPWREAARLLAPMARALEYAHKHNIIHRDVKPSNILVTETNQPMLSDFGIAKILETEETIDLTGTGTGIGTPEYMAPEQALSQGIDHRTDIYALGIVFYEMVTGRKPYRADTPLAVLFKHVNDPLPRPKQFIPDLPDFVEQALIKSLAKNPAYRYSTAAEFAVDLEKIAYGQEGDTIAATPFPMGKVIPIVIGGMVLTIFLAVGIAIGSRRNPPGKSITDTPTPFETTPSFTQNPITDTPTPTATITPIQSTTALPGLGSTQISPKDGMAMVFIPEGDFIMGNSADEALANCKKFSNNCERGWFLDEEPSHRVYLSAFWIDQTEVTNGMYALCVQAGFCAMPHKTGSASRSSYYGDSRYQNYPIIYVDWDDARTYCQWAGKRLPTEAEWEKAARGPNGFIYPWGNGDPANGYLNYKGLIGDTTLVGSYPEGTSYYHVFDMAGNLWEWVADWYGENYYVQSPDHNPTGPATGSKRVFRGGAWVEMSNEGDIRTTARASGGPDNANNYIGFRCLQDASH